MNVLALVHGEEARSAVFGEVAEERGDRIEEWSLAWRTPIPRPLDDHDALLVFGGAMHADQDHHHPWLREEDLFLQRAVDLGMPILGVCLGAQLLAKAAHAPVFAASEPEIGWVPVELTDAAADDPLFAGLPRRFDAFEWHYYTYGVPAGAVELARNSVCTQAFRLGDRIWGVQFHPEVTAAQIEGWIEEEQAHLPVDGRALLERTRTQIDGWNRLGRELCGAFLDVAERVAAPA